MCVTDLEDNAWYSRTDTCFLRRQARTHVLLRRTAFPKSLWRVRGSSCQLVLLLWRSHFETSRKPAVASYGRQRIEPVIIVWVLGLSARAIVWVSSVLISPLRVSGSHCYELRLRAGRGSLRPFIDPARCGSGAYAVELRQDSRNDTVTFPASTWLAHCATDPLACDNDDILSALRSM